MHRAGDWLKRSIGGEAQDLLNVVSVLNVIKDSDCVQQTRPVVCQAAERVLNPKHKHQTYNGEERMSVSHPVHRFHRTVASVSIVALLSSSLLAQTGQTAAATLPNSPHAQAEYAAPLKQYTQPNSILTGWKPYAPHGLPQPVLRNSDRLHSLIKDGKLMLSLNDAVALALENNFDIAIARYNLDIADTDLLLAKSGGTVRGVSSGLLTGTPGGNAASTSSVGATGSGSGGTSTGVGGAGSGSGGIVQSTQNSVGAPIDPYDPTLAAYIATERILTPVTYAPQYYGVSSYQQNTNDYNFTYTQGWATGTLATVSFTNDRLINNLSPASPFANSFNPQLSGAWRAQLRQHLLQGWGMDNNRREIIIARNNRKVNDASFRAQVISTVAQIRTFTGTW